MDVHYNGYVLHALIHSLCVSFEFLQYKSIVQNPTWNLLSMVNYQYQEYLPPADMATRLIKAQSPTTMNSTLGAEVGGTMDIKLCKLIIHIYTHF